jgi:hypothetical protein
VFMEQSCCPLEVEMVPGNTSISAPNLPRERELSLEHAQRCSFLIKEQCRGPLAVEMVPGNTAISAPILPREPQLSLENAQRSSFLNMEQSCGPLAVEIVPGKHCDFSTYLAKRARAKSGACAEVQFPDFGTVLLAPVSRNNSRKAPRFHNLSCQESEISVWSMRRGAVS